MDPRRCRYAYVRPLVPLVSSVSYLLTITQLIRLVTAPLPQSSSSEVYIATISSHEGGSHKLVPGKTIYSYQYSTVWFTQTSVRLFAHQLLPGFASIPAGVLTLGRNLCPQVIQVRCTLLESTRCAYYSYSMIHITATTTKSSTCIHRYHSTRWIG